jgi:hypothetical protein
LGVWAILGAVCGGLFAYYREHLLTKDELRRLGRRLPGDSSAFVAFVQGGDGAQILSSVAPSEPAEASVAAIGPDLSARVLAGAAQPQETSSADAPRCPRQPRVRRDLVAWLEMERELHHLGPDRRRDERAERDTARPAPRPLQELHYRRDLADGPADGSGRRDDPGRPDQQDPRVAHKSRLHHRRAGGRDHRLQPGLRQGQLFRGACSSS